MPSISQVRMYKSIKLVQVPPLLRRTLTNSSFPKKPTPATRSVATKTYSSYVKKPLTSAATSAAPATGSASSTSSSTSAAKPAVSAPSSTEPASAVSPGFKLNDSPVSPQNSQLIDWADSFHGIGTAPFAREIADILLAPIENDDIEIKPDGLIYLPEIKYRRILNRAFGPGGWGLVPRTETAVSLKQITREYGLICHGRYVSVARGEQDYFGGEEKIATALEGCKSNALMRCCKDLGIASELWDPNFIRKWKAKYADEVFGEHVVTKKKKKLWKLKSIKSLDYPYKQC